MMVVQEEHLQLVHLQLVYLVQFLVVVVVLVHFKYNGTFHIIRIKSSMGSITCYCLPWNAIPSNYSMPSRQELKSRYESEFPQTWQNLIKPADMTVARKHVSKTAQRLSGDELNVLIKSK